MAIVEFVVLVVVVVLANSNGELGFFLDWEGSAYLRLVGGDLAPFGFFVEGVLLAWLVGITGGFGSDISNIL